MPNFTPDPNSLDAFRRRARYRAWHRGTKELDLILGAYADANANDFDAVMLASFEALMENEEVHLAAWLISGLGGADFLRRAICRLQRRSGRQLRPGGGNQVPTFKGSGAGGRGERRWRRGLVFYAVYTHDIYLRLTFSCPVIPSG